VWNFSWLRSIIITPATIGLLLTVTMADSAREMIAPRVTPGLVRIAGIITDDGPLPAGPTATSVPAVAADR
jgi:hypothetical protein